MTKIIKLKPTTAADALKTLRAAGIPASLAGSHGGDGLHSQGGNITGINVPETFYRAYKARAAQSPCSVAVALQAAIDAQA